MYHCHAVLRPPLKGNEHNLNTVSTTQLAIYVDKLDATTEDNQPFGSCHSLTLDCYTCMLIVTVDSDSGNVYHHGSSFYRGLSYYGTHLHTHLLFLSRIKLITSSQTVSVVEFILAVDTGRIRRVEQAPRYIRRTTSNNKRQDIYGGLYK